MRRGGLALAAGCLAMVAGCGGERLQGTAASLEVDSAALEFGTVALGDAVPKLLVVRNAGRAPARVHSLALPEPFRAPAFPEQGLALGGGDAVSVEVVFAPRAEGRYQGELRLASDAPQEPAAVALSGEAVLALLRVGSQRIDFGQVRIGSSAIRELEIANDAPATVQVPLEVEGPDASQFAPLGGPVLSLAPGARAWVQLQFWPSHLGVHEASMGFQPCPGCARQQVQLAGEGSASCLAPSPATVSFGPVDAGLELSQPVFFRNEGNAWLEIAEVFLAASSSPDFAFDGYDPKAAVRLAPGESLPLTVRFKPSGNGPRSGWLRARGQGPEICWAEIRLTGEGGTGCLAVYPPAIDFGLVASGMTARRTLAVGNAGCGSDVWVEQVALDGPPELIAGPERPAPFLLRQGESANVRVSFSPSRAGSYGGRVRIGASDALRRPLARPPGDVPVVAEVRALAPCQAQVFPPRLDFGMVSAGSSATLALHIENVGPDACYISNLGLSANSDPAFHMREEVDAGLLLAPGEGTSAAVTFSPTREGPAAGALELYLSNPADPYRSYPLTGLAASGCLSVEPRDLSFGARDVSCPPATLSATLLNRCAGDLELRALVRGPGASEELTVLNPPAFPFRLEPNTSFRLDIRYQPVDAGFDVLPLYLDDGEAQHLLSASGRGEIDPLRTDVFAQPLRDQVDVLFVLDNSGSMADKQAAVGRNLDAFLRRAQLTQVDYQLAVTSTGMEPSTGGWTQCPGGAQGGEAGRLFPIDRSAPRVLSRATANPEAIWAVLTRVGVCHWLEQGLQAAVSALTPPLANQADDPRTPLPDDGNLGFMRGEARLAVIFVSDEEDQSPGPVELYLNALRGLKADPSLVTASAIVTPRDSGACPIGTSSGNRYIEVAERTGGVVESICTQDWAASLERLGDSTFGSRMAFKLSSPPADPAGIAVRVNGIEVPAAGNWRYQPDLQSVVFTASAVPPPGARVEIRYRPACAS